MICDHLKLRDEHDVYIYTVLLLVNLKELNLDKGLHRCGCGGLLQLEKTEVVTFEWQLHIFKTTKVSECVLSK